MKKFYFLFACASIGMSLFVTGQSTQLSRFQPLPPYNVLFGFNAEMNDSGTIFIYRFVDTEIHNSAVRLDRELNVIWNKTIYTDGSNLADEVMVHEVAATDQSFYMLLDSWEMNSIMKTDRNGEALWTKRTSMGSDSFSISKIHPHGDSLYVLASDWQPGHHFIMWKLDELGNPLWQKRFTTPTSSLLGEHHFYTDNNGSIYVAGSNNLDLWNMKISPNGNLAYSNRYQSPDANDQNQFMDAIPLGDGRVFATGFTKPGGVSINKRWLYGISDSNGVFKQLTILDDEDLSSNCEITLSKTNSVFISYNRPEGTHCILEVDFNGNLLSAKKNMATDTIFQVLSHYEFDNGILQMTITTASSPFLHLFQTSRQMYSCLPYEDFAPQLSTLDISSYTIINDVTVTDAVVNLTSANDSLVEVQTLYVNTLCTSAAGVDNNDLDIQLYPNPGTSSIKIESPQMMDRVEILSMSGISVLDINGSNTQEYLNIENLDPGIYIVKISVGNRIYIRKWVKV